jgi:hypothetical protein
MLILVKNIEWFILLLLLFPKWPCCCSSMVSWRGVIYKSSRLHVVRAGTKQIGPINLTFSSSTHHAEGLVDPNLRYKKTVTGFRYHRACRFRKYQFENRSWELPLPTFFKTWFLKIHKMWLKLAKIGWQQLTDFQTFFGYFHVFQVVEHTADRFRMITLKK